MVIWLMLSANQAEAAKKRVWKKSSGGVPSISARWTKWKQYLAINFGGLGKVEKLDYELTYSGNGTEKGVFGSMTADKASMAREVFLGTCSRNVCVAHQNIGNVRLVITYKMKDGKVAVKRYKVKY